MQLTKFNQIILEAIAESEGPVTLGLLPLSQKDEEACISDVVDYCAGRLNTLVYLLQIMAPAAAAYAIAAGASQSVVEGARFWEPFSKKLNIDLTNNLAREQLSNAFRAACRSLGVVAPDVSEMPWKNIAPMMAQASILHLWTEALGAGVQTTLRNHPLPDLEDSKALRQFAKYLASHIHSQQNLRSILLTEVGPIVVHRLISSCIYNRYDILPSHLVEPMKKAFEASGRQVTLKSPYVSFSMMHGGFELVLPKQPGKLTSYQTHWLVNGNQYSPVTEERLSEFQFEVGSGKIDVRLKKVGSGYPDQEFMVNLALDEPFRIFEQKTMREKSAHIGEETTVPPGEYLLIMKPEVTTNDANFEEIRGAYKVLDGITLRPGLEPLVLTHEGVESTISPALKAGIYQSDDAGHFITIADGTNLHYGKVIGFQAFIPKNQHSGEIGIQIYTGNDKLLEKYQPLQEHEQGVYDYSQNLQESFFEAINTLPPGIHPIQVRLTTNLTSVIRDLWYWKGLEHISKHLGFKCSNLPQNIEYRSSKGIQESKDGCAFTPSYTAPRILIALKGGASIELLRPGVQAISIDPEDGWKTEIRSNENFTVRKSDTRVIQLESGGFEKWSIQCNEKEFAVLDQKKTKHYIGIRSILAEFGKSGRITAVNEEGEMIRLFGYSSGLIASPLLLNEDHGKGIEKWSTKIPLEGIGRIGLIIRDYSQSPVSSNNEVITLCNSEDFPLSEDDVYSEPRDGIRVLMKQLPAVDQVDERLKVSIHISPEKIAKSLLMIEMVHMANHEDEWSSLHCIDSSNASQLCIVVSGEAPVQSDDCTWWNHLWRISQSTVSKDDCRIYESLTDEDLRNGLQTISRFTTIKYPSNVYFHRAKYFSSLSHRLATRCESIGFKNDNIWWDAASEELADHADALETPLTRQFHFTQNHHILSSIWAGDMPFESSKQGSVMKSLSLVREVQKIGGRVKYARAMGHSHPIELFTSFKNFSLINSGKSTDFNDFDFNAFFKDILKRTLQHAEGGIVHEAAPVLSARHLLQSINALNRRVRVLNRASAADAEHVLSRVLQSLSNTHIQLENKIITLNSKIGYRPEGRAANLDRPDYYESLHFPELPSLSNNQAKQIADLTWGFCLVIRAKAHGKMGSTEAREILNIFSGTSLPTHPINLILSFAPELFSYYIALLDFALFKPESHTHL